jgi:hypothetical protein
LWSGVRFCTVAAVPSVAHRPLRIVIANLPSLLGDLLTVAFEQDGECEIVARLDAGCDLERALADRDADFVLVGVPSPAADAEHVAFLLEQRARPQLVGIDVRDGRGTIYRLRPERRAIGELSPPALPGLLRECLSDGVWLR